MNRNDFTQIGSKFGLSPDWILSELDSLSYAHFLNDLTTILPLPTSLQIHEFILCGKNDIWEKQEALYQYLFGLSLPYRKWTPKVIRDVLHDQEKERLKQYIQLVLKKPDLLFSCTIFNRYALYDSPFLQQIHKELTPIMQKSLGKNVKPTYSYLSMYNSQGICPPHRDISDCQWTLDLCVNQDQEWPIHVEDKSFILKENEALIYSGTDQLHWRERIHPNGHCHLVFFHFKEI
jgi:hypothetical protein